MQVEAEDLDIIEDHGEEAHRTGLLLSQEPHETHQHNRPLETQPLFLQLQWRRQLRAQIRTQTEGTMGNQVGAEAEGRVKEEERLGM